jgi:hypothetical protein
MAGKAIKRLNPVLLLALLLGSLSHLGAQVPSGNLAPFPLVVAPLNASDQSVIILIHGWTGNDNTSDPFASPSWDRLLSGLQAQVGTSTAWKILLYRWQHDSATGPLIQKFQYSLTFDPEGFANATLAASNGSSDGDQLALTLAKDGPNLRKVIFVAHSAGAWVAYRAMTDLLAANRNIVVSLVLLDPFVPGVQANTPMTTSDLDGLATKEPDSQIFQLENYFSIDATDDFPLGLRATSQIFTSWRPSHSVFVGGTSVSEDTMGDINYEVDWTDPLADPLTAIEGPVYGDHYYLAFSGDPIDDVWGHFGPIWFYADTVNSASGAASSALNGQSPVPVLVGGLKGAPYANSVAQLGWWNSMFMREPIFPVKNQPKAQLAESGSDVSFTSGATTRGGDNGVYVCQWCKNGQPLPTDSASSGHTSGAGPITLGSGTTTLTIHSVTVADAGQYTLRATTYGVLTNDSEPAALTYSSPSGTIRVSILPAAAVSLGAMWSLDGQTWESSGSSVTVSEGSQTVYFKSVPGWSAPTPQTASVSSGGTTPVTGQYTAAAQTGTLTVLLYPNAAINAGAQWQVDGGAWYNLNSNVTLSTGAHQVAFKQIQGWTAPAALTVTIAANSSDIVPISQATYSQVLATNNYGSVEITLSPSPGARWSIYSGTWQDSGVTVNNVAPGSYTVSLLAPPGYLQPSGSTVINVTAGNLTQQTFTFPPQADWGNLVVNLEPASAAQAGARWSITGYPQQTSGSTLQQVPAGAYQLEFTPVSGYVTPSAGWVYPAGHATIIVAGNYTALPLGAAVQVLLRPNGALSAGAQWRVDGGAWNASGASVSGLSTTATHTIDYQSVAGWIAPASQTVSTSSGLTTTLESFYTEATSAPQIFTVTPSFGSLAGGTLVDITGANLSGPVTVSFGGVPATTVNVISSTEITAVAPPQTTGSTVSLEVSTGSGAAIQTNGFTYGPSVGKNIQLDYTLGGSTSAVDLLGTHAFVGQGASLVSLDISNPANPVPIGQLSLPFFINHLSAYQGGDGHAYAVVVASVYVAGATDGVLLVVDVTDPTSPLLKSTVTTGGDARNVKVTGGLAYVCDGYNGLEVFDLSDPVNPKLKGSLGGLGYCTNILLDVGANGTIAYLAEASGNSVEFVDVSDPTNPIHKGGYVHGIGWAQGICALAKAGNVLYVGPERQDFILVDVTSLTAPTKVGDLIGQASPPGAMLVQGSNLYSFGFSSLAIFDVSSPAHPVRLYNSGLIPNYSSTYINDCALSGNYLFNASLDSGIAVFGVGNSSNPSLLGVYQQSDEPSSCIYVPANGAAIYSGTNTGFNIYSVASASSAHWVAKAATTPNGGGGGGFGQQGNLLFQATSSGMFVVDVTNLGVPVIKGNFSNTVLHGGVGIDSLGQPVTAGFKTTPPTGVFTGPYLWTVDASNPSTPTAYGTATIGTNPTSGTICNVIVSGHYAYVADSQSDGSGGLRICDLSNPQSPQLVGSLNTPGLCEQVAVSVDGTTAYLANGYVDSSHPGGVLIVDVSKPNAPAAAGSIFPGQNTPFVSVSGSQLIVCSSGVHIFDISNPLQPNEIANYVTAGNCLQAVMNGNQIYVADGNAGVSVLTLKDYTAPTIAISNPSATGSYTTSGTSIDLGGTASDNTGVAEILWSNNRGGSGTANGTTNWTVTGIALQPGDNVITVTTFDTSGNVSASTITVHSDAVAQAAQTINFPSIQDMAFGNPLTLSATATSGLPVSFEVESGPATLGSDGVTLTFSGTGIVTVLATQLGNDEWLAAASVEQSFNVLQPVFSPVIATPPQSTSVDAGSTITLNVLATGTGPLNYQWSLNGSPIPGATSASLTVTNLQATNAGTYTVTVGNTANSVTSQAATVTLIPAGTAATHAIAGSGYTAGLTVTVTNTMTYTNTVSSLGWSVLLPTGWSFASSSGSAGDVGPTVGDTDELDWAWTSPPASPVTFTYTLNVPAGTSGQQSIAALAVLRPNNGLIQILAQPDPLIANPVSPTQFHSADENQDGKISLLELTRVIELYNTHNGTTRTGAYTVQAGTEDGFAPDPTRTAGAAVTLATYHSADENHDGKISLLELTRVIELYNYHSGSVRTGQYHAQAGTEDGFAPGP